MFEELSKIAESASQKEKFRTAANKLLNECFILKRKEDTKAHYLFIRAHKELFAEYFDLLNYDIIIHEDLGLISLKNRAGTGRLTLTKMQSILLLILRLLYLEKRNDISNAGEEVTVLMQDIRNKFDILKTKNRLDKTTEREAIAVFKRYNLVRVIDADISQGDSRIEIFPSVLMAIPAEGINALYDMTKEKLAQYSQAESEDDDEESE